MYYYVNDANCIESHTLTWLDKKYKTYTLEEYKQIQKDMEKRTIKIDLTTARKWYNQDGDLRKVALQAFTENELNALPKSWEEYCKINPYLIKGEASFLRSKGMTEVSYSSLKREAYPGVIPSKERAKQFLILNKLLQIRDYYNQDWEPNWSNGNKDKYCIVFHKNDLQTTTAWHTNHLFAFKTIELRNEFLQNFKEDLKTIKEFL